MSGRSAVLRCTRSKTASSQCLPQGRKLNLNIRLIIMVSGLLLSGIMAVLYRRHGHGRDLGKMQVRYPHSCVILKTTYRHPAF